MTQTVEKIRTNLKKLEVFSSVKITPGVAKELLEMNTDNRPVKNRHVRDLTDLMKKGEWRFTGDTLRFSKTGRLLDGQHRLMAIVASNTSQVYNIQTGLEDDVFDVIDTGKNRHASDVLAIQGYKNPGLLQAAIKLVIAYDNQQLHKTKSLESIHRPTNHEVGTWLHKKDEPLMLECVERGSQLYNKTRFLAPGTYAGFLYILCRKNKEMAIEFFDKFVTGEHITSTKDSPIYILRQKFINMQAARARVPTDERYALVLKAWNFYRDGVEIKRLSWNNEESFPKAK